MASAVIRMEFVDNNLQHQRYTGISKPGCYFYVELDRATGTVTMHALQSIVDMIWGDNYIGQILETFPLNETTGTQNMTLDEAQAFY